MIPAEHSALWTAIQQFAFDDPVATITFSRKLANKQNWSAEYTQRVIEEYRRFIFLCCISPTGASPSKEVDEVWHLHLTYTHSYWIAFCRDTLGKEIHHHPSAGGDLENHKHQQWYQQTLALYQQVFDVPPPADIWPGAASASVHVPAAVKDNRKWIRLLIVVMILLAFVISYWLFDEVSPFGLTGPQFLWFYAVLALATVAGYGLSRKAATGWIAAVVENAIPANVNVYQLTHFLYGRHRAFQTALVDLLSRNLLTVNENDDLVVHPARYQAPATEHNPLLPGLLQLTEGDVVNYELISMHLYNEAAFTNTAIEQLNKVLYPKESLLVTRWMFVPAIVVGILRIMQGWSNDRPFGFLLMEIIAMIALGVLIEWPITKGNLLFKKGEAYLKQHSATAYTLAGDFAIKGGKVLLPVAGGAVLATLFAPYAAVLPAKAFTGSVFSFTPGGTGSTNAGNRSSGSSGGGAGCGGCGN